MLKQITLFSIVPLFAVILRIYGPPAPAPGCGPNGPVISCKDLVAQATPTIGPLGDPIPAPEPPKPEPTPAPPIPNPVNGAGGN